MASPTFELPRRALLLDRLHERHTSDGYLSAESVAAIARDLRIPAAEAWEAATAYPDFAFEERAAAEVVCGGLSCRMAGAAGREDGKRTTTCRFRCFDAPAPGEEAAFPESAIRHAGPLLAPDVDDRAGLETARRLGRADAMRAVTSSGLRGRGGAYFPAGRKWAAALAQGRPTALVVNAEEGEPGVFRGGALLGRRPRRWSCRTTCRKTSGCACASARTRRP